MTRCYVTQARLKELFIYDDKVGSLVRVTDVVGSYGKGSVCDKVCTTGSGYSRVFIDGGSYYVHKLVFLYVNGYTPS